MLPGTSGRGFTAKEVHVGITVQANGNAFASSVGVGVTIGDPQTQNQAIVDDLNARGGLLGRKIIPEFFDAPAGSNSDTTAQAACTHWTQDHKVVAVANGIGVLANPVFYQCMAKAGVPFTSIAFDPTIKETYDQYSPYWYAPSIMDWTRLSPVYVDRLIAQKYFTGWNTVTGSPGSAPVKIGLALPDQPSVRSAATRLVSALRARGYTLSDTFYISSSDGTGGVAASQSAMLKFASEGITHVVTMGAELLALGNAANSNGYHPRFSVTSYGLPGSLLQVAMPASALAGTLGVGLLPGHDVDDRHDPGPVSPAAAHCLQLMKKAGQANSRFAVASGYLYCDAIGSLVNGFNTGGGFTPDALRAGVLRNTFQASFTFASRFSPDRFASALVVRDLAYLTSCTCFVYPDKVNHPAN